jgi:tetratricopeptide (TPR) repeat protein
MKTRSALLFLLVVLSCFTFTLTVYGQETCTAENLLAEPDILTIERRIPGCRSALDDALTTTLANLESAESPDVKARYGTIAALIYSEQGSDYEARIAIQQALLDWREAGDGIMEARVQYYLGTFYYKQRQYDQGNTFYNQGLNVAERNDDTFTQGRIRLAYGRRELELGNNENALGMLTDSLPFLLQNPLIAVPEQIENLTLLSRVNDIFEKYQLGSFYQEQASFLNGSPNWYTEVVGEAAAAECPFTTISDQTDILAVERGLPSCILQLAGFLDETQTALDETSESADRARLQTITGLIYSAKSDPYNASLTHERALLLYREVGDRAMESWTLYYMARAYYAREQAGNVPGYLGQAQTIAEALNDSFQLGRVKLFKAQYEIQVNNNYGDAALIEEDGLKNLQAAGDIALPEQIQMLQLLNQTYSVLGDLEKAGHYLRLAQGLKSGGGETDDRASSLVLVSSCQVNHLVNQFDVVYAERQMD